MKKTIILCLILNLILSTPVWANIINEEVAVYSLEIFDFDNFIQNPSENRLRENCYLPTYYSRTDRESGIGQWKCGEKSGVYWEREVRLGSGQIPLDEEFFSFLYQGGIEECLKKNGYDEKIENMFVLECGQLPLSVVAECEQTLLFVTVTNNWDLSVDDKYIYKVYTISEFKTRYERNEYMFFVNGTQIESENKVFSSCGILFAPVRTVFENIGVNVSWDNEKKSVILSYNNKNYLFDPNCAKLTDENENTYEFLAPGGSYYCCFIEDRVYVSMWQLIDVVKTITGYSTTIDSSEHVISIMRTV